MSEEKPPKGNTRAQRLREGSQQRRAQEKLDARQAILEMSSQLFLETGYDKFSLRQVAERLGYSPGTLYLYFEDKDELLFTIMNEGVNTLGDMMREAGKTVPVAERLSKIARAYVAFGLDYPIYYQLMFMQRPDFLVRKRTELPLPLLEFFMMYQQTIEEAMRLGIIRMGNPVGTADALWAVLHGVVSIALSMPLFDKKRIQGMVDVALELLLTGIHHP